MADSTHKEILLLMGVSVLGIWRLPLPREQMDGFGLVYQSRIGPLVCHVCPALQRRQVANRIYRSNMMFGISSQ